ncbi:hypothetical protein ACEPAF_9986 [Sanghuangporus sanghuang]
MSSYPSATTGNSSTSEATTGDAGASGGQGGGGGGGGFNGPSPDETMVYWLDIALLCVVGAFFLAFLPRMIGRLSNFSEWTRRLILRAGSPQDPMVQRMRNQDRIQRVNTATTYVDGGSDQSHTLANHSTSAYAYGRSGKEWSSAPSGQTTNPPAHVVSLTSLFHPLSKPFGYPISPGKSLGKYLLVIVYMAGVFFLVFFNGGDPLADSDRLGYIAISQIPVAVALGTKNNVIGMLLGMGYERLNYLHRAVGIVSFAAAGMHALGYLYKWAINESLAQTIAEPFVIWGLVGLGGVSLLFVCSIPVVRQRAYTFFLYSHIAGYVLYLIGICYHESVCINWALLSVGIYGLDHFLRVIKTRFAVAKLTAVPELGITRVELPGVGAGWRAGQHVRLRVMSGEMGLIGWSVAHPFTIANASDSESGHGLVLLCKKAGSWTDKLYAAANRSGSYGSEEKYGAQRIREMRVIVEGPYGGLGNMVMSSYSSVLLVTGGSGVTFGIGQAEELVQHISSGKSAVKFIELVWITQDKSSLSPMLPTFASLLNSVANIPGVIMRITVHYTRADKQSAFAPEGAKVGGSSLDAHLATLAPNLTLHAGRPSLPRILSSIASLTSSLQDAKGLAVGVCGPLGLAGEVQRAVRGVDGHMRSACGGIEVHEEVFGW